MWDIESIFIAIYKDKAKLRLFKYRFLDFVFFFFDFKAFKKCLTIDSLTSNTYIKGHRKKLTFKPDKFFDNPVFIPNAILYRVLKKNIF